MNNDAYTVDSCSVFIFDDRRVLQLRVAILNFRLGRARPFFGVLSGLFCPLGFKKGPSSIAGLAIFDRFIGLVSRAAEIALVLFGNFVIVFLIAVIK